jgi:hypothetical protein
LGTKTTVGSLLLYSIYAPEEGRRWFHASVIFTEKRVNINVIELRWLKGEGQRAKTKGTTEYMREVLPEAGSYL